MHQLRTDTGLLVGTIDNRAAGMMISQCAGRWIEKNFKVDGKTTVFEFTESQSFGNGVMKFHVHQGFYLLGGS